MSIAI